MARIGEPRIGGMARIGEPRIGGMARIGEPRIGGMARIEVWVPTRRFSALIRAILTICGSPEFLSNKPYKFDSRGGLGIIGQ
jgi:hypothetical protein